MTQRSSFLIATLATLVAGFVDAIGYAHIGKLYLSFMSGNSTRFGAAVAAFDVHTIAMAGIVIAMFVIGAGMGALLTDAAGDFALPSVVVAEIVLFVLALGLVVSLNEPLTLLPIATAMGMQNSIHQSVLKADIGKSFVTGSLFSLGQSLARSLRDRTSPGEWIVYGLAWLSFVTGVALGTLALIRLSLESTIGIVIAALVVLALLAYLRGR